MSTRGAIALIGLVLAGASAARAGDALFFSGHSGLDEGHTQFAGLIQEEGGVLDFNSDATLPSLAGYRLVLISLPGFSDPEDFFTAPEIDALQDYLADPAHRVVVIGEWDGFYWAGTAVMMDLIAQIGAGTGIQFLPGLFDSGCLSYDCGGDLGTSPLVAGLDHVCKADTAVWDEGLGTAVARTVDEPHAPWIVAHEGGSPCLVALGDSNVLSDGCQHLDDPDTAEFARRLYRLDCAGEPIPVEAQSWGKIKLRYQ